MILEFQSGITLSEVIVWQYDKGMLELRFPKRDFIKSYQALFSNRENTALLRLLDPYNRNLNGQFEQFTTFGSITENQDPAAFSVVLYYSDTALPQTEQEVEEWNI